MDESILLPAPPENPEPSNLAKEAAEILQPIADAMAAIIKALAPVFKEIAEAICEAAKRIAERFSELWDALLRSVATRKEWHLYKHAKKKRTRKKYKNRLTKRLLAMMAKRTEDDENEI